MKIGIRTRVFLVTLGLTCVIGLAAGAVLEIRLRAALVDRVEEELDRATLALEAHLSSLEQPYTVPQVDEATDRMAKAVDARLTVIAVDGRVLGESELDGAALQDMDNHRDRPEVVEAQSRTLGVARRRSSTMADDLLYVARTARLPDGQAITLRAGKPLSQVSAAVWSLRLNLLLSAILALGAALVSATVVARWMQGTLERLVDRARVLSGSERQEAALPPGSRTSMTGLSRRLESALDDLAEERDRREAVLAGVTDAVIAVDRDLRVTLMNPAATQLLGPGAVGKPLDTAHAAPELVDHAQAGVSHHAPLTAEVLWRGPPDRQLQVVVAPLHSADGAVIVLHDLTEVRSLERVRQDFVANVSHELRTPVAIIAATTETLVDGAINDPEFAQEFIEAIHRHATRLGSLVDDLLSLSRIESGRLPLAPESLRVGEVARSVAALVGESSPQRTPVAVDIPPDLTVWADLNALQHALRNLAENAVKYVPPDAPITIRARKADDRVFIEVVDEGPGIPTDHADRVFERFYRVDRGRSRDVGGTGLGLSIVRHLTEVMGGVVSLTENDPHGCVFRIDLPAARPTE